MQSSKLMYIISPSIRYGSRNWQRTALQAPTDFVFWLASMPGNPVMASHTFQPFSPSFIPSITQPSLRLHTDSLKQHLEGSVVPDPVLILPLH